VTNDAATNRAVVAQKYAECPISFKPLHKGPVGVLVDKHGKRVSHHFYDLASAKEWIEEFGRTCPMSHEKVKKVKEVPKIQDKPKKWFKLCDIDSSKSLTRREVVEALKAQLPLDIAKLERLVADNATWRTWDKDGSGSIEYDEIINKETGLLKYVRDMFSAVADERPVPDLRTQPDEWFAYWDENGSGHLEFNEVARAMVKTFKLDTVKKCAQLQESLRLAWFLFDGDNSGTVSKEEFLRREGLADTIQASMMMVLR